MISSRPLSSSLALVAALVAGCETPERDVPGVGRAERIGQLPDTGEDWAITHSAGRIRRQGLTLAIRVASGRVVALTDDTTEGGSAIVHHYDRHLDPIPFHGIRLVFYEGGGYLLVHDSTGRQTHIDARPELAPDGIRWVTVSLDLFAQFIPNRMVIGRIVEDTVAVEWSIAPTDWGPAEARWVTTDTIRFTEQWNADRPDFSLLPRSAMVVRSAVGWQLVESQ